MDDKLINLIVTVVIIGIWAVQFFVKQKPQQEENYLDDDDDEDSAVEDAYAEDPYRKVQEEIRRKIAERKAAEQINRQAPEVKQTRPLTRPQTASAEAAPSRQMQPQAGQRQQSPSSPLQRDTARQGSQWQKRPMAEPLPAAGHAPATIDEIRRRREQAAQQPSAGRPVSIPVDRQLRPIPQPRSAARSFPIADASASMHPFPVAAQAGRPAYHGSTKLRRTANPRNTELKAILRRSGSTRQAMLLREILGEPIALRDERRF